MPEAIGDGAEPVARFEWRITHEAHMHGIGTMTMEMDSTILKPSNIC